MFVDPTGTMICRTFDPNLGRLLGGTMLTGGTAAGVGGAALGVHIAGTEAAAGAMAGLSFVEGAWAGAIAGATIGTAGVAAAVIIGYAGYMALPQCKPDDPCESK